MAVVFVQAPVEAPTAAALSATAQVAVEALSESEENRQLKSRTKLV